MPKHNARYNILHAAYNQLIRAAQRSSFIQVSPINERVGWPPEEYLITYTCKGIARLDEQGIPIISEFHQMELRLSSDYPARQPVLRWLTDIWHPNFNRETHHVCTDEFKNYRSTAELDDFLFFIGRLVQYQSYFHRDEPPFPDDKEVARWVREVAEPNQWVGPGIPIDNREITNALRVYQKDSPQSGVRLPPNALRGVRLPEGWEKMIGLRKDSA